jgi:hypothetical protein
MLKRNIHPNRRRVLEALERGIPLSQIEIGGIAYVSPRSVREYLQHLRATNEARIAEWRDNSPGSPTPLWMLGSGEDAPKPTPMTSAECRRRSRAKDGVSELEAARKRAKRHMKKLGEQSMLATLLGV